LMLLKPEGETVSLADLIKHFGQLIIRDDCLL
jgi:hypothetical protein